jgi:hypothetical protein
MQRILLIFVLLFKPYLAQALPPSATPGPNSGWYESLRTPEGNSCCSLADCRHFPVKIMDGHYQVLYQDKWMAVPDAAVLKNQDNPTGDYVTCIQREYYYEGALTPRILCFVRAPGL